MNSISAPTHVVKRGVLSSLEDIFELNIIDWNRLYSWRNAIEAARTIASWFADKATYTIIDHDLRAAPSLPWSGWNHTGGHDQLGHYFWNDFYAHHTGELLLKDEPDLEGYLIRPDGTQAHIWGDIGICSAAVLAHTQKQMHAGDLWISVLNEHIQVIIEPFVHLYATWERRFEKYVDEETMPVSFPANVALPESFSRKRHKAVDTLTLSLWG